MPAEAFDSSASTASSDSTLSMTGAKQARFVNHYSPYHDRPYEHLELNSDVFLDETLSEKLLDDRRRNVPNHLVTDKAFKEYMANRMQFTGLSR